MFFAAPHSFTGEDVLELHGHGGPIVLDMLLQAVLACPEVRLARPGEFSERAFLNGKIDLSQAEAIADLIDSGSSQAARSATRSLQGKFSATIHQLVGSLTELRVYVESAIDFPDEEIEFLAQGQVRERLLACRMQLKDILDNAQRGCLLRDGLTVVIAGPPNAGKSSLMNQLARRDTAIVTDIPGTTRDVLKEQIQLDGLPLHIVDTAGLRHSDNPVEQIGIARARGEIEQADVVIVVIDATQDSKALRAEIMQAISDRSRIIVVKNKIDLTGVQAAMTTDQSMIAVSLSAMTGEGISLLEAALKQLAGYQDSSETPFIARRRHLQALNDADAAIGSATDQLESSAAELVAEDLRQAQRFLSSITGEFTTDDLLEQIFSSFCIGK